MTLSRNEAIREILREKGIDTPVLDVIKALKKNYPGITNQHVHNVRYGMKSTKPGDAGYIEKPVTHSVGAPIPVTNQMTIATHIEALLKHNDKPLTHEQITDAVLVRGYKTTSDNFPGVVKQQIYRMSDKGIVKDMGTKDGSSLWGLTNKDYNVTTAPAPAQLERRSVHKVVSEDFGKLIAVHKFADEMGGIEALEEYIAALKDMNDMSASALFSTLVNRGTT